MKFPNRIRELRRSQNLTLEALAEKSGLSVSYLSRLELGERNLTLRHMTTLAKALETSERDLVPWVNLVPLVGYVGALGEIRLPPTFEQPAMVEPFPMKGPGGGEAIMVVGDAAYPRYLDGDCLYFRSAADIAANALGFECVITLDDGRRFLRTLASGTAPGLFNLESWNAPPIRDQVVKAATPILWVRRSLETHPE